MHLYLTVNSILFCFFECAFDNSKHAVLNQIGVKDFWQLFQIFMLYSNLCSWQIKLVWFHHLQVWFMAEFSHVFADFEKVCCYDIVLSLSL